MSEGISAIKIDITKTNLHIPRRQWWEEYIFSDRKFQKRTVDSALLTEEQASKVECAKLDKIFSIKRYVVVTKRMSNIHDAEDLVPKQNYLIPVNDQELFDDLIQISDELILSLIQKRTEGIRYTEAMKAKEDMRNLPWWRRLFKKF